MKIFIVEDDPILNKNINEILRAENINTESAFDGLIAEKMLKKNVYDCVILDINLPGKNGYDLCRSFRLHNTTTPVIMLTAFSELEDKIQGYDSGADDYLTKPFYMRELVMRINALIKRNNIQNLNSSEKSILTVEDITLNDIQKKVIRNGQEITLTPREYQILFKLMQNQGEIISKAELIEEIWGNSFDTNTNTIEVYISFLRNKIDKPFGKNTIKTKVGYGYYLDTNEN